MSWFIGLTKQAFRVLSLDARDLKLIRIWSEIKRLTKHRNFGKCIKLGGEITTTLG
jgi:hypothetical protein